MYSATKNAQGNYEIFQNGQRISTGTSSILGNYGLSEGQLSTPAPTPSTSPTGVEPPPRNDQQSNPNGYNGTPDNPTNTDAGLARVNASAPQPITRNPGESASDFATRLLNSPFFLAGGGGDNNSAFVFDQASNSYVAKPASSVVNRPVNNSLRQNVVSTNSVGSSGGGSIGGEALLGSETEAEKRAREYLDSSFKAPEDEATIIARKTAEASSRIQANKDYFASLLGEQGKVNDQRNRETNARAVLSGLSGSSEAGTMAENTGNVNKADNQKILAQQQVALENIYKDIQDNAHAEFDNQKQDAYKTATDILARKDELKTKAVTDISMLAKSGFDFASIKANDPVTYAHLAQSVGGEAQLNAISVLNRPQESIIDKKVENGKYVIAYQNPLTGKVRIESTDLGIPPQYTKSIDLGDKIMFVPDNFNPAVDKPLYVTKGIAPKAPSTAPQGTEGERKSSAFAIINKLAQPGVKDKTTGVPYISPDGYFTFEGFKTLVKNAIEDNVTRDEFISQYVGQLLPGRGKEYGLTATEIKKYGI